MGAAASAQTGSNKKQLAGSIAATIQEAFTDQQLSAVLQIRQDSELLDMIFDALSGNASVSSGASAPRRETIAESLKKAHKKTVTIQEPLPSPAKSAKGNDGDSDGTAADEWLCEKCSEPKEDKNKSFCLKCASWGGFGSVQGDGQNPFPESFVQDDDGDQTPGWICGNCNHKNESDAKYCVQCATVHARATHVAPGKNKAALAVLFLDDVEVIDGKKAKNKKHMDGHSGDVTETLDMKQKTDGNTGSVTTTVKEDGATLTTHDDKGPDVKDEGRWACDKCGAKNLDMAAQFCQTCATNRGGSALGLMR